MNVDQEEKNCDLFASRVERGRRLKSPTINLCYFSKDLNSRKFRRRKGQQKVSGVPKGRGLANGGVPEGWGQSRFDCAGRGTSEINGGMSWRMERPRPKVPYSMDGEKGNEEDRRWEQKNCRTVKKTTDENPANNMGRLFEKDPVGTT